jgi:hypothetical protein
LLANFGLSAGNGRDDGCWRPDEDPTNTRAR